MECTENNKKNQNNNEITVISFALPQKKHYYHSYKKVSN